LYLGLVTPTGLDQRTINSCLADARAAMTKYDDALAWLETAMKGPMEPIAAEVWAFNESFTHVLLVRHRWRGWVPPGGRVEGGETPREAAHREFLEETGLDGHLLETPIAVTVRAYRADWTPTLGLSYGAVLNGDLAPAGESHQPAAWMPLPCDWEGAFPADRQRIRAFAWYLKARPATAWMSPPNLPRGTGQPRRSPVAPPALRLKSGRQTRQCRPWRTSSAMSTGNPMSVRRRPRCTPVGTYARSDGSSS